MRDKDIVEDADYIEPVAGLPGPIVPVVDGPKTIDDQFPDEEKDAGDEMIAPNDDPLLQAGSSPEFDHSLKNRKASADH